MPAGWLLKGVMACRLVVEKEVGAPASQIGSELGTGGDRLPGPWTRLGHCPPLALPPQALLALCLPHPGTSSVKQWPCFLLLTEQEQLVMTVRSFWPRALRMMSPA